MNKLKYPVIGVSDDTLAEFATIDRWFTGEDWKSGVAEAWYKLQYGIALGGYNRKKQGKGDEDNE